MRHASATKVLLSLMAGFAAALFVAPAEADQTLPSVQVGSLATPVDPTTAYSYYSGVGLTSSARTVTNDPEIVELARALHNDPDLIYEWVRNNVEIELRFGLAKGARGAAIDKSGTAFDQAHLMVELLRASGITATYQFGTITLTGQQFTDWTGISNADAANAILASGGIPATVSGTGSSITSVTLMHLWLKATIGGTQYSFDPAYKPHTFKTGIDVGSAMGFSGSTFVSDALSGSTSDTNSSIPKLRRVNLTNVWSDLGGYANTLLTYLKTNMPNAELDDVIGGQRITRYAGGALRQASLPYSSSVMATFSNDVPNVLRTTYRIHSADIDKTLYVDEFYGCVLSLGRPPSFGDYASVPLSCNDQILQTITGITSYEFTIDVNHPYAASSGAYMDVSSVQRAGGADYTGRVIFVYGFGNTSAQFGAQIDERTGGWRQTYSTLSGNFSSEAGPTYTTQDDGIGGHIKAWTGWLSQFSRMAEFYDRLGGVFHQHHHSIGVIANLYQSAGDDGDLANPCQKINIESGISLESKTADASGRRAALSALVSGMSTLEGSVAEQVNGSSSPVSVASKLDWVNRVTLGSDGGTNNDWVYLANSSNWSSVDALLLSDSYYSVYNPSNYTYSDAYRKLVETQAAAYIAAGYTLIIPRSSNLGPGAERTVTSRYTTTETQGGGNQTVSHPVEAAGPDRGGVIIAYKPDDSSIAYIVVRSSTSDKGGGGKVELDPSKVFSPSDNWQEQQYETKAKSYSADLQTGALTYAPPADLVAGKGDFPYSLPFQRSFRAGFGQGWQHNWQSDLTVAGSGMAAMSDANPQAAAETIAALWTQLYLAPQTQSTDLAKLQRHVVAATVNMWWAEKAAFNTATVSAGPKQWSFTRLADNSFAAPPGDATVLTVPTSATYRHFGGDGGAWYTPPQTLAPVAAQGMPKAPAGYGAQGFNPKDCTSFGTLSDYRITMREKDQTLWTFDFMCADIGTWDRYTNAKPQVGKTGYRLQTIAFPYGVNVTLTYATNPPGGTGKSGTFYLTRVENNLGRSLNFAYVADDGSLTNGDSQQRLIDPVVSDTTNGGTGRAVHITGYFCDTDYNNPEAGELTPLCQGTINSISDPLGHSTRYATTAVVAPGTVGSFTGYSTNGGDGLPWPLAQHIAQVFYPTDTTTPSFAYAYDSFGRLKTASDALSHQWVYRVANGRRGDITDPTGGNSATVYDDRELAIQSIDALGNITTTEYDSLRRQHKVTAAEGNSEEYVYDAKSNVAQTTKHAKPGSSLADIVTSTTYDSTCNVPLTETDALSRVTTNTINTTTCLTLTTTGPTVGGSAPVTTMAYDSYGHVTSITDPTGLVTTYSYNSTTGNLSSAIIDPGASPHIAATTVFAYDTFDNITSLTDPRGNVHTATYDLARRLTQYNAPTSTAAVTKWTYNDDGFITKIERATSDSGNPWAATNYAYWPTGRLKTMTDADGQVTRYDYDAANRHQITTDPENRRVFTQYDLKGQVTKEIRAYATPLQEDYATCTYSANGQKLTVTDAQANTTTYVYDGYDRLLTTTFPDSTYEAATYDAKGNQLTKRNRAAVTLTFTFDALDRMATKVMPLSGGGNLTTTWTYDLAGRVTDLADSAGYDLAYAFDTAKRITSVTRSVPGLSGTQVVAYQYDAGGNKTRVTWPDSYYVDYQFDALNRMTTANENGTYLLATYTYDKLSRRASLVYGNGAYTNYSYTQQGDLTSLAHNWLTSGGAATGNTFTHSFTKAHQLASAGASDTNYLWDPAVFQTNSYATANNLNQYGTVTFGSNAASTLTYDATGNMTSDGVLTMTYDAENRLLTASKSGMSATYEYDPMGRRAKSIVNSTTTFFLDSEEDEIADYDGSGNLLRRYVLGAGKDAIIAIVSAGSSPSRDYLHTDQLGSTASTTDNSGHLSQGPFTYDAYGQSPQSGGTPFRFSGRRLDAETGLYYVKARFYSASLGRFLQTDPVGYSDQQNLYAYVSNDPVNLRDPNGAAQKWGRGFYFYVQVDFTGGYWVAGQASYGMYYNPDTGDWGRYHTFVFGAGMGASVGVSGGVGLGGAENIDGFTTEVSANVGLPVVGSIGVGTNVNITNDVGAASAGAGKSFGESVIIGFAKTTVEPGKVWGQEIMDRVLGGISNMESGLRAAYLSGAISSKQFETAKANVQAFEDKMKDAMKENGLKVPE